MMNRKSAEKVASLIQGLTGIENLQDACRYELLPGYSPAIRMVVNGQPGTIRAEVTLPKSVSAEIVEAAAAVIRRHLAELGVNA